MIRFYYCLVLVALLAVVPGCGGGSRSEIRLVSLTIQSPGSIIPLGSTANLAAVGNYSDGTSVNMTSLVTWSSSNQPVATISGSGLVTSVSGGTTTITAVNGTVTASVPLNIVPVGGGVQGTPLSLVGTPTPIASSATQFTLPVGVTSDGINLYVADSSRNEVRKIVITGGSITTVAGSSSAIDSAASVDGTGDTARFYHPEAITCDGSYLYVAERQSGLIRKVDKLTGTVTTMITSVALTAPAGITTDGVNLYVTDSVRHVIQKINIGNGVVSSVAGTSGSPGSNNGTGAAATFNQPVGITTDGSSLYVNDFGNGLVRRITIASGAVTTVASGFTTPAAGIATDGSTLYVADYSNSIKTVPVSGGTASTLTGPAAGLIHPEGLASDGRNLFVIDSGNHVIVKIN